MNESIEEQEYLAQVQSTLGYHDNDQHSTSSRVDSNYDSAERSGGGQSYSASRSDIQEELRYFATSDAHQNSDHTHHEHHQQLQQQYHQQQNNQIQFISAEEPRHSVREQTPSGPTQALYGNQMTLSNHNANYHQQLAHNHALQAMTHPYYQNEYQNTAAVPIPQVAVQLTNIFAGHHPPVNPPVAQLPPKPQPAPLQPIIHEGEPPKPRSFEEEYAIIIQRTASASAKSSNTKYRCLFCNFTFVGGPQKIRVHLTGKRENGTRLSRCEHCPEDVRKKLEERMKAPKELVSDSGLFEDNEENTPTLPPRNVEEQHTIVLSRSGSSNSKSSNTRYKCLYCRFKFVGGPQKIRVHLTGQPEGGTRMAKCSRVPPEAIEQMEHRRKAPRLDLLTTPASNVHALDQHGLALAAATTSSANSHASDSSTLPHSLTQPSLVPHPHLQQNAQQHALNMLKHQQQAPHVQHLSLQHQQQQINQQRQQHIQQLQQQQQYQQIQQHFQNQQQIQQQYAQHSQQAHLPLGGMLPHAQHPQHMHPQALPLHLHSQQLMMQHPDQILLQQQLQQQHLQRQQQMQHAHNGTFPAHHVFHMQASLPIPSHGLGQSLPAHMVLQQPFPPQGHTLSHPPHNQLQGPGSSSGPVPHAPATAEQPATLSSSVHTTSAAQLLETLERSLQEDDERHANEAARDLRVQSAVLSSESALTPLNSTVVPPDSNVSQETRDDR